MGENGLSNDEIILRIREVSQAAGLSEEVQTVLERLYLYMMEHRLCGGCHALSSVLYVALSEIGESPELCIGECFNLYVNPFDHSWVLLDGKVIDLAIYLPLSRKPNSISGVVVMDTDIITMHVKETLYGYVTGLGLGPACDIPRMMSFDRYMDSYPYGINGLWGVVAEVLEGIVDFDISRARERYKDTVRQYKQDYF